ncbi:hypothetical protein [Methylobacterium nodulans]|uniref:Uncharacterized protein n=1 Tax=Methylobacterium nodulans (strain LMG 21967 / CNCM I-2342 / ORS 2060) TaxID=460265 RepID=B8ICB0_METNO|nr:hypothetical protein [Methylobacterium nodulans]ACL55498.1 hypothetical protein Mnod_0456 [Methylobacterium nodulans ORS 2060]
MARSAAGGVGRLDGPPGAPQPRQGRPNRDGRPSGHPLATLRNRAVARLLTLPVATALSGALCAILVRVA